MISIPRDELKRIAYTASERMSSPAASYWFSLEHAQTGAVTTFRAYVESDSNERADVTTLLVSAPDDTDRTYAADAAIAAGTFVVTTGSVSVAAGKVLTVRGVLVTVGSTITGTVEADGGVVMNLPAGSAYGTALGLVWLSDLRPGEYAYEISATQGGSALESGMLFVDNYDATSHEYDEKSQETKTVYYEPGT